MKRNVVKVFLLILMAVMLVSVSNVSFASSEKTTAQIEEQKGKDKLQTGGGLVGSITPNKDTDTAKKANSVAGMIVGILQVIGVAAAIIMLVFLGIKYVSAAPSEKADIKKSAAIYVVGAVMLLGATVILGWIETFVNQDLAYVEPTTTNYTELA